jgi:hypothetical protein
MTGSARVPQERMSIFAARALLQIKLASLVKNQDVDSAMTQVIPMHFGAGRMAQNPIHFIDHWEELILECMSLGVQSRRDVICQANPLIQR